MTILWGRALVCAVRPSRAGIFAEENGLRSSMVAVYQVKRFKGLRRRRRSISDTCIRTDVAVNLPTATLAGATIAS